MVREHNGHVHLDEEEASGGSKEGVVRWILLGGLLLAIVLLSITWIVPALMQGDVEEEATVSGEMRSMDDGADAAATPTDLGDDTQPTETDQTTTEDGVEVIEN